MAQPEYRVWTDEEEKFLIKNYGTMTSDDIAEHLNRDRQSVNGKAYRLRMKGKNIYGKSQDAKIWTKEEEEYIKSNYGVMTTKALAEKLNTTYHLLYKKAEELNLTKTAIVEKDLGKGLGLKELKVIKGNDYEIKKTMTGSNKQKRMKLCFEGELIQETKVHITLKNKNGRCETFLKADLLLREYEIKEAI